MAEKPDTEKGWLVRALLRFLQSATGLVVVCVLLNVTGIVKWQDVVDLLHGRQKPTDTAGKRTDPPQPPTASDAKIGPRDDGRKTPDRSTPPVTDTPPVVPPNAPPRLTAKPDAVTFEPGVLTKQIELVVADEEPVGVKITTTQIGVTRAGTVKVDGSGATRFLTVTANPDEWGSGSVRVTATDAAGLAAEATVKVTVPPPALSIREIPPVSVAYGEPMVVVPVAVDDAARKPGVVTFLTPVVTGDPLFGAGDVSLDQDGKKLKLKPKAGASGTAEVKLTADAGDGRQATRTFKVTIAPKPPTPLRVNGKATVVLAGADATTAIYAEATGDGKQLGVDSLDKGTVATIDQIKGNRCFIRWEEGGKKLSGWVEKNILVAVEEP